MKTIRQVVRLAFFMVFMEYSIKKLLWSRYKKTEARKNLSMSRKGSHPTRCDLFAPTHALSLTTKV